MRVAARVIPYAAPVPTRMRRSSPVKPVHLVLPLALATAGGLVGGAGGRAHAEPLVHVAVGTVRTVAIGYEWSGLPRASAKASYSSSAEGTTAAGPAGCSSATIDRWT